MMGARTLLLLLCCFLVAAGGRAAAAPSSLLTTGPLDRSNPLVDQAFLAVDGAKPGAVSGPLARLGFDLALLFAEHREFKARGGTRVTGKPFQASNGLLRVHDEHVVVDIAASGDAEVLRRDLRVLGMRGASVFGNLVSGSLPIEALPRAASLGTLRFARPAYAMRRSGSVTSQGDAAMQADVARSLYGVDGSGVMVGTLSDSYDCLGGAAGDVAAGDLPAGVTVLAEISSCSGAIDEGRAMMQIVHDVAPGASQAFHTAFDGVADFANGIVELATPAGAYPGADIINDDIIYFAEPMFQDGPIAQAVDTVKAMGVAYFSSAGNDSDQSYEDSYRSSGVSGYRAGSIRHDFDPGGGTDSLQQITIPAGTQVIFVLQWDDPHFSVSGAPGADTDMDIIIYSSNGKTALAGGIAANIGGDPVEVFGVTNSAGVARTYNVAIDHVAGPAPGRIKFVYYGDMTVNEYATDSSTVYGHANADGARAVGAARYTQTPEYGVSPPVLEYFSALGGLSILFDTAGNPVNVTRQKPEIVAPDGVDTTFFGSDYEGNGFPNFFGTSAAAPHAAAVGALLKEADAALTPDGIYTAMQASAIDMGAAGVDDWSGHGLIQADQALAALAPDADGDGILDGSDNCVNTPNPLQEDNDGDGQGDACDADDDNDGLSDIEENALGSDPLLPDTDGDGLNDGDEVNTHGTSPVLADTDGDGLSDGDELNIHGSDPLLPDTDGDGLADGDEVNTHGTSPVLADTDGDGFDDAVELAAGSDPLDPGSLPPVPDGDVNGDGTVDARDVLLAERITRGDLVPDAAQTVRTDVAPLVGGVPSPDGNIDSADVLVIQRKVSGMVAF